MDSQYLQHLLREFKDGVKATLLNIKSQLISLNTTISDMAEKFNKLDEKVDRLDEKVIAPTTDVSLMHHKLDRILEQVMDTS
jgi:hypothetical protein